MSSEIVNANRTLHLRGKQQVYKWSITNKNGEWSFVKTLSTSECIIYLMFDYSLSLVLFLNPLHLDPRLPEASGSEPGRQDEL